MFVTKLLVGEETFLDRDCSPEMARKCKALIAPPINPRTKQRYSSVSGCTGGSKVWIVYGTRVHYLVVDACEALF